MKREPKQRATSLTAQEAFRELTRRVGPELRERGFKGSGQNFTRACGAIWQGVFFQRTAWRWERDQPVGFTLNLGTHFADYSNPSLKWRKSLADVRDYRESTSNVSFRVGDLLHDGSDTWWRVNGGTLDAVTAELSDVLRLTVIPFLELCSTREGLCSVLRSAPWMVTLATREWMGSAAPPLWEPDEVKARALRAEFDKLLRAGNVARIKPMVAS